MSALVIVLAMLGLITIGCVLLAVLPGTEIDKWLTAFLGGEPE